MNRRSHKLVGKVRIDKAAEVDPPEGEEEETTVAEVLPAIVETPEVPEVEEEGPPPEVEIESPAKVLKRSENTVHLIVFGVFVIFFTIMGFVIDDPVEDSDSRGATRV